MTSHRREAMSPALLTIGGIGFFSLLAQALLFRDFLAVFDGNELTVGIFFASWLGWMAIGAAAIRPAAHRVARFFAVLPLLYLPAFLIQKWGFMYARMLAGTEEYSQLSLWRLAVTVTVVNAPVALLSGGLMVAGATGLQRSGSTAVSRTYVADVCGSSIGALTVTLLLASGTRTMTVFLLAATVLAVIVGVMALRHWNNTFVGMLTLVLTGVMLLLLLTGTGKVWQREINQTQWRRLLPDSRYQGSFITPQARYLYGSYRGSTVVTGWGGVCETLPNREGTLSAMAAALVQQPEPGRILLIGSGGAALCSELVRQPEVREVVWLAPDPAYPAKLLTILPKRLRPPMEKLTLPGIDVRQYLRQCDQRFDLVLVRLQAPTSLVMNRYFSQDFFREVKAVMNGSAVLAVSFPGGENYLGAELALTGASLLATLERIFPKIVLQPGTESCFFAGNKQVVTDDPARLAERFGRTALARKASPVILDTVYDQFRRDFQMGIYRKALNGSYAALPNTDQSPRMFLYSLLLYLKKYGGMELATKVEQLLPVIKQVMTWWAGLIAAAGLLLAFASFRRRDTFVMGRWRLWLLVAVSSVVAMGADLLLLLRFQYDYGSLYLYFGLANALFMFGLFIGGRFMEQLTKKGYGRFGIFTLQAILLAEACRLLAATGNQPLPLWLYAVAFPVLGFLAGTWLPRAAWQMKQAGRHDDRSAAQLYAMDSLGGALGALLVPLFMLPLFGSRYTLLLLGVLALLPAAVGIPELLAIFRDIRMRRVKLLLMPLMLGTLLLSGWTLRAAEKAGWEPQLKQLQALGIKPDSLTPVSVMTENRLVIYFRGGSESAPTGYLFRTADLVKGIKAYAGPVEMLVWVAADGRLRSFIITATKDTPRYMAKPWKQRFKLQGMNLFKGEAGFPVDAVTGATYSARGIVDTLNAAGRLLGELVRAEGKLSAEKAPKPVSAVPSRRSQANGTAAEIEPPPPGKARDIDAAAYQTKIRKGELSNHPAMFAKTVE